MLRDARQRGEPERAGAHIEQLGLRQRDHVGVALGFDAGELQLFGEDVGVKGGVHLVTEGLQKQFGVGRVFDTSLSEEGIVGRAAGMAGAYTALACDEGALHYNPASLSCAASSHLELTATAYVLQALIAESRVLQQHVEPLRAALERTEQELERADRPDQLAASPEQIAPHRNLQLGDVEPVRQPQAGARPSPRWRDAGRWVRCARGAPTRRPAWRSREG